MIVLNNYVLTKVAKCNKSEFKVLIRASRLIVKTVDELEMLALLILMIM